MVSASASRDSAASQPAAGNDNDSRFRLRAGCVLILAAILFFARLGARALWSSEFRWAEIAREMLVTHNYFWPTINGHVYYDKPLGSYWLVIFSTPLTGGLNEAATRLPCAIAGLLAVALLMLLVRRLYDARAAILAGVILATSFSFVFFSRHASADVETLTGELAALLLFNHNEDRGGGLWVVGLWLIMAATSLTKGLLGFALPLLVIGVYSCLRDGVVPFFEAISRGTPFERVRRLVERNRWFFNWYTVGAVALGGLVYYLPFQISSRLMGSEKGLQMVYRENVVRFFHPFDHRGPIYLYVYVIFGLMAPWSALLPASLVETHGLRRCRRRACSRGSICVGLFLGDVHIFQRLGIAPQLLHPADSARRGDPGRQNARVSGRITLDDRPPPADYRLCDRCVQRDRRHRPADSGVGDSSASLRRVPATARRIRLHRVLGRIGRRGRATRFANSAPLAWRYRWA